MPDGAGWGLCPPRALGRSGRAPRAAEKEIAAMMRAGHGMGAARAIWPGDMDEAQSWVDEARPDDGDEV
jgi:hypothetical protein